ncbi:MAG: hypothetical protein V3U24_00335 [Candidatus Neomarinimicrobiota bacterium]
MDALKRKILLISISISFAFGQTWQVKTTNGRIYRDCIPDRLDGTKLYFTQEREIDGRYWDITLTSGQRHRKVTLSGLTGDTLDFSVKSYDFHIPLRAIYTIKPTVRFGKQEWLSLAKRVVPYVAGLMIPVRLAQEPQMSPQSSAGTFPLAMGLAVGIIGAVELAKVFEKQPPAVEFRLYDMTPVERLGAAKEILMKSNQKLSPDQIKVNVKSLSVGKIKEIELSKTRRTGFAGIKHTGHPIITSLVGMVFGAGSGYFLGASTISGCGGADCVQLKQRLIFALSGSGAMFGYLGGRDGDRVTAYYTSHLTFWETEEIVRRLVATDKVTGREDRAEVNQ